MPAATATATALRPATGATPTSTIAMRTATSPRPAGRIRPAAPARDSSTDWRALPRDHRITQVFRTLGGGLVAEYDPD